MCRTFFHSQIVVLYLGWSVPSPPALRKVYQPSGPSHVGTLAHKLLTHSSVWNPRATHFPLTSTNTVEFAQQFIQNPCWLRLHQHFTDPASALNITVCFLVCKLPVPQGKREGLPCLASNPHGWPSTWLGLDFQQLFYDDYSWTEKKFKPLFSFDLMFSNKKLKQNHPF